MVMGKYRRKPIVIEANQFWHAATGPLGTCVEEDGRAYVVTAHEQKVYLEPGDWIVAEPGVPNRFYPIKPEIFSSTYEAIALTVGMIR
jgi:hypothetical protein